MRDLTCRRGCVVITAESRRRNVDAELYEIDIDEELAEHNYRMHGGRRPEWVIEP